MTKAELEITAARVADRFDRLEKRFALNVQQLWDNQSHVRTGLEATERHLRAYRRLFNDVVGQLNNNGEVVTAEIPGPENTPTKVINMRYYLTLAEAEMKQLAQEAEMLQKAQDEAAKKAKEKPEEAPAQEAAIPEGAAVFGGNNESSNPGNEGQETTAGPGSGGEDGTPGVNPESTVPNVQVGNGDNQSSEERRVDM